MRLLLDTHIAIWAMSAEQGQMGPVAAAAVKHPDNELVVSMASIWEVAIKTPLGKLHPPGGDVRGFRAKLDGAGVVVLDIRQRDLEMLETLPLFHRDPFDRLIIAQARADNLRMVSTDRDVWLYAPETIR